VKTRRIYASIAGLLQVNSTQLALKIAAWDKFIIRISGYLYSIVIFRHKKSCIKQLFSSL